MGYEEGSTATVQLLLPHHTPPRRPHWLTQNEILCSSSKRGCNSSDIWHAY